MKSLLVSLVILLACVILLAGCSSSTATSSAPTAPPSSKQPAFTQPSISTTASPATPAVKKGGTLKIIYGVSPNALGYGPAMQRSDDILAASPCVETLVHIDESGAIVPWLATDLKGDATAKTLTITVRKGVKFHDGTDFNAQAVKWNLEQQMAIKRAEVRQVQSIDAIDDSTLRLNLANWDNALTFSLASYVGVMTSPAAFEKYGGQDGVKNNPVGTGPFKFVSFNRDVSLKYEKFNGYWQQGKPYLDRVEFNYIADPVVRLASFKASEGQVLLNLDPNDANSLVKSNSGIIVSKCLGSLYGLAGDGSHANSPFTDIRVRQAIEYALDRGPSVQTIGVGTWDVTDQPCAKNSWGYDTSPSPYSYNPQKAKALLAEAGYPNGLEVPLIICNTPSTLVDIYTAFQAQLNAAGFKASLSLTDPAKFNDYVIKSGWNNGIMGWNCQVTPDASRTLALIFSSFGVAYRSILYPPEIDTVIGQITKTSDFAVMKAKTQEGMGLIRNKYCTLTTLCSTSLISVNYSYLHDAGFFKVSTYQNTLQDAWLEK
jgi:peptide/nickel transport system substrate-binding protein